MPESSRNFIAACHFLNVGQGTSQVIFLGGQRVVIIDTGPKRKKGDGLLCSLLKERNIQCIEALVLSHNDSDHVGETENIFVSYAQNIKKVFLLNDREPNKNSPWNILKYFVDEKRIDRNCIKRLEVSDDQKEIFSEGDLSIDLLFPSFYSNMDASDPNTTSAIVALTVGTQKIIFSGDAPIEAWKEIVKNNGKIQAQIVTVPHHGGGFASKVPDLDWFHAEAIEANKAIVSIGTINTYNHPNPGVIESFVKQNSIVLCTQQTQKCYVNTPKVATECCGTIIADIGTNQVQIKNLKQLLTKKEDFPKRLCSK